MNSNVTKVDAHAAELALVAGDLGKLNPEQRVSYYREVCSSLGLNPLTRPFDYLNLNGKLTLYARKDATDQLRRVHCVSIGEPQIRFEDDWIIVTVGAKAGDGRTDADVGVVSKKDMRGDFGNALMKAVTKAKRRVTLSLCGLGMLDETEVETIPGAQHVEAESPKQIAPAPAAKPVDLVEVGRKILDAATTPDELRAAWMGLTAHQKGSLEAYKNQRKTELQHQAADRVEPPPEPGSTEPEDDEERAGIITELYEIAKSLNTTPKGLLGRHDKQVGHFPESKPLPAVEQLTLPQLRHLLNLVHQNENAAIPR